MGWHLHAKYRVALVGVTVVLVCVANTTLPAQETQESTNAAQAQGSLGGITINGDTVEYLTGTQQVVASGNVEVLAKGSRLTCEKLTVNTQTKEGRAQGKVRLDDRQGVVEGEELTYNFVTKIGVITNAGFRANPYFGRTERLNKVSDNEFITRRGYVTTCAMDRPHYRIGAKKVDFLLGDKVDLYDTVFYVGPMPVLRMPRYTHSLQDPLMHVQLMPGKSKEWGPFFLTAWRYKVTDYLNGRIYADYRSRMGMAEGFGANYTTDGFGKGDFKYYYTQERPKDFPQSSPAEFQRYMIRWIHKWDIDERTNFISEYYRIVDAKRQVVGTQYNMLKDYFPREYEKDSQPLSYMLYHHSFNYASLDFVLQKRTNRWYSQLEKLPEVRYFLSNYRLGESPVYFEHYSQYAKYIQKNAVPSSSVNDIRMNRVDTTNKFSLPMRVAFLNVTPFVKSQLTYYTRDKDGSSISPRSIFYSGADASTKFYRVFDLKTNFLGLNINRLRHLVSPTVSYSFNPAPSISAVHLKQIDGVDGITRSNTAAIGLSNKLQTKRKNENVDLVDFLVNTNYTFRPRIVGDQKERGRLSDFLLDVKLLPYSWMHIESKATFNYAQRRYTDANYDASLELGKDRSFGFGQRYAYKGGNELVFHLQWRINPKWQFSVYERYQRGHDPTLKRGLREQEYKIVRDLHCWSAELLYNVQRGKGESIFVVFRMKAFPENEFGFDTNYHAPKSGSQSNP